MEPIVVNHPLVQTRLTVMRDETTDTEAFRRAMHDVSSFLAYEATRMLPVAACTVRTPLEATSGVTLPDPSPAVVSILRAGNGLLEGMLAAIPSASVGFLGMARNEETHQPEAYYAKLPGRMAERHVFLVDPMLATGGSACDALQHVLALEPLSVTFVCLVAAPEGVARLTAAYPNVAIVTAAIDRQLNESAYIVPGLGDAGDRLYGT